MIKIVKLGVKEFLINLSAYIELFLYNIHFCDFRYNVFGTLCQEK